MVQRTALLQRVSGALSVINGVAKFLPQPDAGDGLRSDALIGHGDAHTTAPRRPARGALLLTLAVLAALMLYRRPWARGTSVDALIADLED